MSSVLYIHGFLSSPASFKAQQVKAWCQDIGIDYECPALSAYPGQAFDCLRDIVESRKDKPLYLMGSSLGGYYATWFSQHYHLPAVLINPAVQPYNLINRYLDQPVKSYYSDDTFVLKQQHMDELRQLEVDRLQYPAKIWVLLQTGDETLDYRQAQQRYSSCKLTIEEGGDHSFQGFDRFLPDIYRFFLETRD